MTREIVCFVLRCAWSSAKRNEVYVVLITGQESYRSGEDCCLHGLPKALFLHTTQANITSLFFFYIYISTLNQKLKHFCFSL